MIVQSLMVIEMEAEKIEEKEKTGGVVFKINPIEIEEVVREHRKIISTHSTEARFKDKKTGRYSNQKYLNNLAWTFIGNIFGVGVKCERREVVYDKNGNKVLGVFSFVSVVYMGQVIGGASAFCGTDEKWGKLHQVCGMSETRANSRALRNVFILVPNYMGKDWGTSTAEDMDGMQDGHDGWQSERQPVQQNEISENEKKVLYRDLERRREDFRSAGKDYKEKYGDDDFIKDIREKYKKNNTSVKWLVETIANVRSKISDFDTKKKAMPIPPSKDDPPLQAPESIKSDGKKTTTKAETKEVESFADDGKPTGTPKWLDDNGEGDPFLENEGMDTDEFMKNFDGEKGMKENAKTT